MSPEQWKRLKELFDEVQAKPLKEQEEYLDQASGADAELREELEHLLRESSAEEGELSGFSRRVATAGEDSVPRFSTGDLLAGRYLIRRLISRGGMGDVYEADDVELGVRTALKAIRSEIADDPEMLVRFKQEIQMARRVTHPNVCRIYDLVQHDSASLLSMELIEGETLGEYLRRRGSLSPEEALPLIEQMASALEAAHEAGVIHRDFKPGNVMIAASGKKLRAVVMDFGLSLPASSLGSQEGRPEGTLSFMAREQLEGRPISPATDVYALGLVIRAMLGKDREPPPSWAGVLKRCLAQDPARRYARPGEAAAALQATAETPRWRILIEAGIALAIYVFATIQVWAPRPEIPFQQGNWILLGGFENSTGEPLYDNALRAALRREFDNSTFVKVAGQERVDDTLRLLRWPLGGKLDREAAREVALRDGGIAVLVAGRADKQDQGYRFGVDLVDPRDGRILANDAESADSAQDAAEAIHRLSLRVLGTLGEKVQPTLRQDGEKVSSSSLRAVEFFDRADAAAHAANWINAARFSRAALAEDPNMASAHLWLAWALKNMNQPEWSDEIARARELEARATERERLFIEGSYYKLTGQQELSIAPLQQLVTSYPDHYFGHTNLASSYGQTGKLKEQTEELIRAAELRPNDFHSQTRVAMLLSQVDLARGAQYARRAISLGATADEISVNQVTVFFIPFTEAWLSGSSREAVADLEEVMRNRPKLDPKPKLWFRMRVLMSYLQLGMVEAARQWQQQELPEEPVRSQMEIYVAFFSGDTAEARRLFEASSDELADSNLLLMRTELRLPDAARRWADSWFAQQPIQTELVQGEIALSEGRLSDALPLLKESYRIPEMHTPSTAEALVDAIEMSGDLDDAIQLLRAAGNDERRVNSAPDCLYWLRNQARLAKLYRQVGISSEAWVIEQRLRKMLSSADPDFYILKELPPDP